VIEDFAIELLTQNDHVLAIPWKKLLIGVSGIPDPGFAHEIKTCTVDNRRTLTLRAGAEEDGCPEDPLEGSDQTTILRATASRTCPASARRFQK